MGKHAELGWSYGWWPGFDGLVIESIILMARG